MKSLDALLMISSDSLSVGLKKLFKLKSAFGFPCTNVLALSPNVVTSGKLELTLKVNEFVNVSNCDVSIYISVLLALCLAIIYLP
jgi:hypothetical protein